MNRIIIILFSVFLLNAYSVKAQLFIGNGVTTTYQSPYSSTNF